MINRLLYGLVAAAMAGVLVIDGTFSANLFHAIGEPTADLSLNGWELWGVAIFPGAGGGGAVQGVAAVNRLGMSQNRTIILTDSLLAAVAGCVYHHPPKASPATPVASPPSAQQDRHRGQRHDHQNERCCLNVG